MVVLNSGLTHDVKIIMGRNFMHLVEVPRQPAKAMAYQVRYWSHADKQWVTDYLTFTNKQKAFTFQKTFAANEKATVIATLSNGKKVFISGTKR